MLQTHACQCFHGFPWEAQATAGKQESRTRPSFLLNRKRIDRSFLLFPILYRLSIGIYFLSVSTPGLVALTCGGLPLLDPEKRMYMYMHLQALNLTFLQCQLAIARRSEGALGCFTRPLPLQYTPTQGG